MQLADAIDRRAGLSAEQFEREYMRGAPRPVILTDALDHWGAKGKWTPEFFKSNYGDLEVVVDGEAMKLGNLVDRVEKSTEENPAPYLRNQALAEWPPELLADVSPMPAFTKPNWLESRLFPRAEKMAAREIYIGGRGAQFHVLHYDGLHTHAFLMQLYGDKEYIAFAPDQTQFMYAPKNGRANESRVDDVLNPDLSEFPLFDRAQGVRFQLHAGEMLFVPGGWWHTARILSPSVTVSINGVNRANSKEFSSDYSDNIGSRSAILGLVARTGFSVARATHLFERV